MKKHYIYILFLIFSFQVHAEDLIYLDSNFEETTENNAMFIRHINQDSIPNLILVQDYSRSGTLFRQGTFTSLVPEIKEGHIDEFYAWGTKCYSSTYVNNELHGERLSYYTTGELKRKEQFVNGELVEGICYSPNGDEIEFYPSVEMPRFEDKGSTFSQFIAQRIEYPIEAMVNNISGTVWVTFDVADRGRVKDIQIVKSDHSLLNRAAKQVVKASSEKWSQGHYEGQVATIEMTVPITFQLK